MDSHLSFHGSIPRITAAAAWLALLTAVPAPALEVLSVRALDDGPCTSVMVLVRNDSDRPTTIRDLRLDGSPIHAAMDWDDKPPRLGKRVDWFDVRPRTIPPGDAGVIVLGWLTRDLLVPKMRLEAVTDEKTWDLSGPPPRPELLSIASATFDERMRQLTVLIRNRTEEPVIFQRMLFNGRPVEMRLRAPAARPGMPSLATVVLPQPLAEGADANILVEGLAISGPVKATAWFRAFKAQSLNYLYDGRLADGRDLAEKHVDVPLTHHEAVAAAAGALDAGHGVLPPALAAGLAKRAAAFAADPQAWGWYMQDDAALGVPRPQALVDLGHFLRQHGSPQRQVLCNPADERRYAWVSDVCMNYDYHVIHQGADPTVFHGERSPELTRALNEPAPLAYLVDAAGQSVRWITPVEEELASYAMIGRGVGIPGWFLAVSLWDQGGDRRGDLDRLDRMPWRYQEGVVACKQVWDHVGRLAGVFHLLAPHLAASVPLAGQLRDDRLEVLPVYCHDDLVVTVLLNRRLRCTYPRDYADPSAAGGIRLAPLRNVVIEHPLPPWITPAAVLAIDHDRGLRPLEFAPGDGQITVKVDAVDAVTMLLVCPTLAMAATIQQQWRSLSGPLATGSPIRPSTVIDDPANLPAPGRGPWHVSGRRYRAAITLHGPIAAGDWVRAELPIGGDEPDSLLGFFDPGSLVAVDAAGEKLHAAVDYYRPIYEPYEQLPLWGLGDGDTPGPLDDGRAHVDLDLRGMTITANDSPLPKVGEGPGKNSPRPRAPTEGWSGEGPGVRADYSTLRFLGRFDPRYDVLEIRRQGSGDLLPTLTYRRTLNGKPQNAILPISRDLFDGRVWPESRSIEVPGGRPGVLQLRWLDLIRAAENRQTPKSGKAAPPQTLPPESAGLRFQLRSTSYRIEQIRQFRSRPLLYVEVPQDVDAGQTSTVYAYWDYALQAPLDSLPLKDADRPEKAAPLKSGPRETFGLTAVQSTLAAGALSKLLLTSQADAATAWVEVRDERGMLVAGRTLESDDLLSWQLKQPLPLTAAVVSLRALLADDVGTVIAVDLQRPAPIPPLRRIAQVRGQIESLSCPDRGDWVLAGAAAVDALDADGKIRWTVDLGSNPRQPPHFGPGRNVEQVVVRPDGDAALARTFRWNEKTRQYEGSDVYLLSPAGRRLARLPWRWQDAAGFAADGTLRIVPADVPGATTGAPKRAAAKLDKPAAAKAGRDLLYAAPSGERRSTGPARQKASVPFSASPFSPAREPPYTLHRLAARDGRVIAATTQGRIVAWTADGKTAWQAERPSRIDDARLIESRGLLAIAYKVYPRSWDWHAEAVLELLDMKDGHRVAIARGEAFDDFGHYGTPLVLATASDGRRIFLGDPAGRVYRWDE